MVSVLSGTVGSRGTCETVQLAGRRSHLHIPAKKHKRTHAYLCCYHHREALPPQSAMKLGRNSREAASPAKCSSPLSLRDIDTANLRIDPVSQIVHGVTASRPVILGYKLFFVTQPEHVRIGAQLRSSGRDRAFPPARRRVQSGGYLRIRGCQAERIVGSSISIPQWTSTDWTYT